MYNNIESLTKYHDTLTQNEAKVTMLVNNEEFTSAYRAAINIIQSEINILKLKESFTPNEWDKQAEKWCK